MIDESQIEKWFGDWELTIPQKDALARILYAARLFAVAVNEEMPDGEDKMMVINNLRQNIITVELAIRYRYRGSLLMAKDMN